MRVRCIETTKEGKICGNIFMDDNAFSFGEISYKDEIITDVRRLNESKENPYWKVYFKKRNISMNDNITC